MVTFIVSLVKFDYVQVVNILHYNMYISKVVYIFELFTVVNIVGGILTHTLTICLQYKQGQLKTKYILITCTHAYGTTAYDLIMCIKHTVHFAK